MTQPRRLIGTCYWWWWKVKGLPADSLCARFVLATKERRGCFMEYKLAAHPIWMGIITKLSLLWADWLYFLIYFFLSLSFCSPSKVNFSFYIYFLFSSSLFFFLFSFVGWSAAAIVLSRRCEFHNPVTGQYMVNFYSDGRKSMFGLCRIWGSCGPRNETQHNSARLDQLTSAQLLINIVLGRFGLDVAWFEPLAAITNDKSLLLFWLTGADLWILSQLDWNLVS